MRFKLTLQIEGNNSQRVIPLNYQYECSAVIYKILSKSDQQFSTWLHDNGFHSNQKRFKLFTFSRLQIDKFNVEGNMLRILSDKIVWYITFLPERSTQEFIQGVFCEQKFELGNRDAKIACSVQSIEMMPSPVMGNKAIFETLSPICIPMKRTDETIEYIAPNHPQAIQLIKQNLLSKYHAFTGKTYDVPDFDFHIRVLNEPKSALITIKAGTPEQTKIKGFMCKIEVEAPVDFMNILYHCGIGAKNSLGFGMMG